MTTMDGLTIAYLFAGFLGVLTLIVFLISEHNQKKLNQAQR